MKHRITTTRILVPFAAAVASMGTTSLAGANEHPPIDFQGKYHQNFDQLPRTRGVLPGTWKAGQQQKLDILPGWQAARTGKDSNADIVLREMPGVTITERLSLFGKNGETERAFGVTSAQELSAAFGVALKNTTNRTIRSVKIGYAVEVWGAPSGSPGNLVFSHGTSANGITEANYLTHTAMKQLDAPATRAPQTVEAGETLDGNATQNRTVVSVVIQDLDWKPGQSLFLAWTPVNANGSSLGIDDLEIIDEELVPAGFTGQYRQNFDELEVETPVSLTGTSQVNQQQDIPFLPGWQAARIGGSGTANLRLFASAGADGSGRLYAFGQPGEKDRALGAVSTQTTSLVFGTSLTNTSNRTFQRVKVKYIAELWRTPSLQIDKLQFGYSTSANGATGKNYLTHQPITRVEALDAFVPTKNTSNTAVDGNAAANRQEISGVIEGLGWKPGQTVFFSWALQNGRGSGSGIGIDDFEINAE